MIDPEIAALTYLSAETEAVATHNQATFGQHSDCGTSLCIAGHAAYFAAEDKTEFLSTSLKEMTSLDAISIFYDVELGPIDEARQQRQRRHVYGAELEAAEIIAEAKGLNDAETEDLKQDVLFLTKSVIYKLVGEAEALENFEQWVSMAATESEFQTFLELTSIEVDSLFEITGAMA